MAGEGEGVARQAAGGAGAVCANWRRPAHAIGDPTAGSMPAQALGSVSRRARGRERPKPAVRRALLHHANGAVRPHAYGNRCTGHVRQGIHRDRQPAVPHRRTAQAGQYSVYLPCTRHVPWMRPPCTHSTPPHRNRCWCPLHVCCVCCCDDALHRQRRSCGRCSGPGPATSAGTSSR